MLFLNKVCLTVLYVAGGWKSVKSIFKPEDCDSERSSPKRDIFNVLCPFCPRKLRETDCLEGHILKFHKPLLTDNKLN